MFTIPRIARFTRLAPLSAGAFLGLSPLMYQRRQIFNEAPSLTANSLGKQTTPGNVVKGKSRFGIDYGEATYGSFVGMVAGYFFGRISKILVGVIVTSLMTTEYLSLAGYIDLRPFYKSVYDTCRAHLHREVFVEDPSFKYSFALAFVIAAYNA